MNKSKIIVCIISALCGIILYNFCNSLGISTYVTTLVIIIGVLVIVFNKT